MSGAAWWCYRRFGLDDRRRARRVRAYRSRHRGCLVIAFVRHGQTAVNRAGHLQGRHDAPLTELGAAQAALVANALASGLDNRDGRDDDPPVRVWSSPLRRAFATAEAVAAACGGVAVEVDERLVEIDYGEWDQRALADLSPEVWRDWRNDAEVRTARRREPGRGEGAGRRLLRGAARASGATRSSSR